MAFQYWSLPAWNERCGIGAAPVRGAWTPMVIVVSEIPVESPPAVVPLVVELLFWLFVFDPSLFDCVPLTWAPPSVPPAPPGVVPVPLVPGVVPATVVSPPPV